MKSKSQKKIQRRSKRPTTTLDDYFLDKQIKMILTNTSNFKPNLRTEYGNTALIIATEKGDLKKIKLLLEYGEDINIINSYGRTPLMISVQNKDEKVVKLLLKYKPDLEQYERGTGYTAIYYAVIIKHPKILHMLLEHGANPNIRYDDNQHTPPLIVAIQLSNLKIIKLLLNPKYKVDLYAADGEGNTALGYSIIYNEIMIVKLLLESGVDPNMDCFGGENSNKSALIYSLENNKSDIVKLLIKHGANRTGKFNMFEYSDNTSSKIMECENYITPFDIMMKESNANKLAKIKTMVLYLKHACYDFSKLDFNNFENWLSGKNFTEEKDRKVINNTLTELIDDCESRKKLLENLYLFEKSKKSTVTNFMKNAMENIVDSDKVIPMNVFTFLD